jgi:hypothetical protein
MSVLPAGRRLEKFLPDLDEMLLDPRAFLTEDVVAIGPRRLYGLALLFGIPGAAFLAAVAVKGQPDPEKVALGIGLLLGAMVWVGWSLLLAGHELVLHPDGLEVRYKGDTVWAPWALFNTEGQPFVPDADSPAAGLTLPVAKEAVPFVEMRRDGLVAAYGPQVDGRQWHFTKFGEIVLPARYEIVASDLGALLLTLGRRLGRELPKGTPPPEAHPDQLAETSPPDPAGWITLPLTRLTFPARCCDCDVATPETVTCRVAAPGDWLLGQITMTNREVALNVPWCGSCQARARNRQSRGAIVGLIIGAVLSCAIAVPLLLARGINHPSTVIVVALGALTGGGLVGFLIGTSSARDLPVKLRRYSPSRGTMSLRFRNPAYAARLLEAIRSNHQ